MRRLKLVTFLVVFSLLFTSIAYACSGLTAMQMASMSMPMDDAAMERGSCNEQKQDICKDVRDRMITIKADSPAGKIALSSSAFLHLAAVERPLLYDRSSTAATGIFSPPILKFSYPFTSQVLRI